VTEHVSVLARSGDPQCVLVSPEVRYRLKYLLKSQMPELFVLSYSEMTRDIQVESVGLIVDEPEMAAI
jgi:flagellar biosynthesis component FlhA